MTKRPKLRSLPCSDARDRGSRSDPLRRGRAARNSSTRTKSLSSAAIVRLGARHARRLGSLWAKTTQTSMPCSGCQRRRGSLGPGAADGGRLPLPGEARLDFNLTLALQIRRVLLPGSRPGRLRRSHPFQVATPRSCRLFKNSRPNRADAHAETDHGRRPWLRLQVPQEGRGIGATRSHSKCRRADPSLPIRVPQGLANPGSLRRNETNIRDPCVIPHPTWRCRGRRGYQKINRSL